MKTFTVTLHFPDNKPRPLKGRCPICRQAVSSARFNTGPILQITYCIPCLERLYTPLPDPNQAPQN